MGRIPNVSWLWGEPGGALIFPNTLVLLPLSPVPYLPGISLPKISHIFFLLCFPALIRPGPLSLFAPLGVEQWLCAWTPKAEVSVQTWLCQLIGRLPSGKMFNLTLPQFPYQ